MNKSIVATGGTLATLAAAAPTGLIIAGTVLGLATIGGLVYLGGKAINKYSKAEVEHSSHSGSKTRVVFN
ncbi:hypothetical protein [Brevibacillus brevis]|uniref:hypothetical protein n=1 Tax=Brevibacillus brevis TaxID=1393 RepID=UPI0011579576|nr:hypothetical protein [Lysinibacillus sp. SDF0063]TQR33984.1 hypothetical protein C7Y45_18490 [Lysinibacillus sp. SDF0063]